MKKTVVIAFIIGLSSFLFSQTNQCLVHFDKSFYVTGEVIWYHIKLPTSFTGKKIMLHALFTDQEGTIVNDYFLKTDGSLSLPAYYKIPFDQASNQYHLVVGGYDKTTGQFIQLIDASIAIYNDLVDMKQEPLITTIDPINPLIQDLTMNIILEKEVLPIRGNIVGKIKVTDQQGQPITANLSLAVQKIYATSTTTYPNSRLAIATLPEKIADQLSKQIQVQGRLFDEANNAISANLLGTYATGFQKMLYTRTAADGAFTTQFTDFTGQQAIQFLGYEKEIMDIQVKLQKQINVSETPPLRYTEEVLNYLKQSQQRKKIYQLFTTTESSLKINETPIEAQDLSPDKTVVVEDYESFKDVATFFKELQTVLKFRDRKEGYIAQMFNPKTQWNYKGAPIFIIDGQVTRNADFIAKMPLSQIVKFDLFFNLKKLRAQFSAMGNNGVVMITTNQAQIDLPPNDAADIFMINGMLPTADFPQVDLADLEEHQPNFRPQIYWTPSIQTDENGLATFSFPHTDDVGTFEIMVVGQNLEGAFGATKLNYQVKIKDLE